MKAIIESRLRTRTTEELKNDVREAMKSTEDGANLIFHFALNVLEERLSAEEYSQFEESL